MSLRILSVIVRKDLFEREITLSEMTEELNQRYKDYLFCPNPTCTAKIIFASGKERTYFRTWNSKIIDGQVINQHIPSCAHYVERDLEERAIARNDPNMYYSISADHKKNVLRNAYDREFHAEKFKRKNKDEEENSRKRPSSRSRTDNSIPAKGRAGLGVDGAVENAEREPRVYRKQVDEISEFDYGSVHCISGFVEDMIFEKEYPFFIFDTKDGQKARVLFSEAFAVNNDAQFRNISVYKDYIDHYKSNGSKPFICCIGKIMKDDFGISVIPEDYRDFDFDRKGFYRILSEVNNL